MLAYSERQLQTVRGREIGMVFQDPMTSLNAVLPIGRQLIEGMQLHEQLSRNVAKKRAIDLLSLVGIPDAEKRYNDYPYQFSGRAETACAHCDGISLQPGSIHC